MTAKQFYLRNPEYLKKATRQEMKVILEKKFITIEDVKIFMKLAGRPKDYIKARMEELSRIYYNDKCCKQLYGSEMKYIIEMFKSEMNLIYAKD